MRHSSACCLGDSFGWRPRACRLARATAMPSRVRIRSTELAEDGRDVEEHLAHRVGGVVDLPAERQPDVAGSRSSPIGRRARSGRADRAPAPRACRRPGPPRTLGESGEDAIRIRTGQTVVKRDAVLGHTQLGQSLALGGEGLGVGGAACVAIRVPDMIGV
jgi:hypothetical protein